MLHQKISSPKSATTGNPCPAGSGALPGLEAKTTRHPASFAAAASARMSVTKRTSEGLLLPEGRPSSRKMFWYEDALTCFHFF